MLTLGKMLLSFFAIIILNIPLLSTSYASQQLEDDDETQRLFVKDPSHGSSYVSFGFKTPDSDEEDPEKRVIETKNPESEGEIYGCCLGCYRATSCWAETTVNVSLCASSILFSIITFTSLEESTYRTIGAIGTFFALSGVAVKVYRWCISA